MADTPSSDMAIVSSHPVSASVDAVQLPLTLVDLDEEDYSVETGVTVEEQDSGSCIADRAQDAETGLDEGISKVSGFGAESCHCLKK